MDISSDYTPGELFFSNSLENLLENLKENLFFPGSSPFSKRLVIVPSQAMEKWIRIELARSVNVAAGIKTSFLENALHELFEMDSFPSKLELTLAIEHEIHSIQDEALKKYLRGKERRSISLAKQLATLFKRYGVYGNKLCAEWEKEPTDWQGELWKRVFNKWSYPLKALLKAKSTDVSIHLFAFSHIPPLYFHFFQQFPTVHFYQLSPCQEFWSDLSNEHPILTSFGRVGREMARLIEESELITEEAYALPKAKTQLHRLQRELLTLEEEEKTEDDSLQLHISLTEHHEIENLYRTIIELLQKKTYEPQDILVMAPDITMYEPYIRAVFRDLPYQIADMPMHRSHSQVEGFFKLLFLERRRFSAPAVLELFHHPLFQKKTGWKEEDLLQIREWIELTGIRWGLDAQNRDALLKRWHCEKGINEEGATWKGGIDHLLEELAIPYEPCRIDFTQAELLGEWKEVMDRIGEDLTFLHKSMTLREWVDHLKQLYESFFSESDELIPHLEQLAYAGRHLPEKNYPFAVVEALLKETIAEKCMTINGNLIQAIRFCSMLPMRAIPARVICLIGMNHDTFPRKESLFSLDLLKEKGDYVPSRLDFDRNLFLEALLSARDKLIISYLGCDPFDQTPWPPSSCISPLLPYISQTIKHPFVLPIKEKKEIAPLFTYRPQKIEIPSCQIDLADFAHPFRSPLRHYLRSRDLFLKEERIIQQEEAFHLSNLRRVILHKQALLNKDALRKAQKERDFPIGPFRILAEKQLEEEIAALPVGLESCQIDLKVGKVRIVGTLEGIFQKSLCISEKKTVRGAVRAWPLFLVLTAFKPEVTTLFMSRDGKELIRFFDDPTPYLQRAIEYYFLSQQIPSPLFPDWVEPILKNDPAKLIASDSTLKWALRGQNPLPPEKIIEEWREETEKLYKEMADAWF